MDADGSGQIEYKELNKKLRSGAGAKLDAALMPGAAGKIETRADLLAKGKEKRALQRTGKKGQALSAAVQLEPTADKSVMEQARRFA